MGRGLAMRAWVFAALLVPGLAAGQGAAVRFQQAVAAADAGEAQRAIAGFFAVAEDPQADREVRERAEYELARALREAHLPMAASVYLAQIVRAGPSHPFYLKAVAGLV